MPDTEPQAENRISNATRASGAFAAILGLIALAGWVFDLPALASFGPGWIPMAPSSALLLILFGAAVFSAARTAPNHTTHLIGIVIGSSGALIALLLFFLSYQGIHLEAEHLGLTISGMVDNAPIGHMSPATALCFLLAGLSLVAVLRSFPDRTGWAITGFGLAALLALVSMVFLLAYFFGTPLLYGGKFIPPALTSIIALAALSAALLTIAKPQAWAAGTQADAETLRASRSFMLIFLLMALGLLKVGSIYYEQNAKLQRTSIERELSAVADLEVNELLKWREERLGDAALLYANPVFADLVRRAIGSPRDAQARDQIYTWLRQIRKAYGYMEIHLIDTQGVVRFSVPEHSPNAEELETARQALLSGKVSLDDIHHDEPGDAPHLSLLVPILDAAAGGRPLGIVMLEIDAGRDLYPLLGRWPTQSPSAETLLVRRDGDDVLYLNELRYRKNTALTLRYPLTRTEKPAVKAVLGQEGIIEGTDYRGEQVIAATRKVPGTPWFLVTRMDKNEFLAAIQGALWLTASLVAAILFSAAMALKLIGRQQRMRHYAERARAAEALASSAVRYQAVIQTAADAIVTADSSGIIVKWNPGAERMFGYAETEIIGQPLTRLMPERFQEGHLAGMKLVQSGGERHAIDKTVELAGWRKDASEFPLELSLAEWSVEGGQFFTGTIRDITERKAAEAKIQRHTQLYAALSQCNEAIVRCTSEAELFPQICRTAVEFGGMNMAWIGIVDSETLKVRPVASFGDDNNELGNIEISADADSPFGGGPTSTAIRENRPYWCQDFLDDPATVPWREYIMRHDLAASAALPLYRNGIVFGAFNLYSSEVNAFDESARHLLTEMATDISFALDNFAREAQRKQAEEQVRAAEEQFRGLVEQSITGIYIVQDGKIVYANPRLAEIVDQGTADELTGSDPLPWVVEADRGKVAEMMRRLFDGEVQSIVDDFRIQRRDGVVINVGTNSARATHEGRPAIIGMLQDISEKKRAKEAIQHYIAQLKTAFMSTVEVATILSEMRDPYTAGHERRVAQIAVAIGAELGFDESRQEGLKVAGSLHDVGKIIIPSEILSKPGKLSTIEFQLIQGHTQAGYDVLKDVEFPWPVAQVALQHHERIDGSGYPQGLKGDAILFEARIMAVADVVEAMSSHRPYRPGLGIDKALAEIERGRGTAYDAAVADACLSLFREKGYRLPA